MTGILGVPRRAALAAIAALVAAASLVSFAESLPGPVPAGPPPRDRRGVGDHLAAPGGRVHRRRRAGAVRGPARPVGAEVAGLSLGGDPHRAGRVGRGERRPRRRPRARQPPDRSRPAAGRSRRPGGRLGVLKRVVSAYASQPVSLAVSLALRPAVSAFGNGTRTRKGATEAEAKRRYAPMLEAGQLPASGR